MNPRKGALCVLIAVAFGTFGLVSSLMASQDERTRRDELPLGNPGLEENRDTEKVAPGVTYTRIVRGRGSERDFYTVDVAFEESRRAAEKSADRLRTDGYRPRVERVADRAPDDPARGPAGYLVWAGRFTTRAEADALRSRLTNDGYEGTSTVYTGEDGGKTTGPWVVSVLRVDPDRYDGTLGPELATEVVPGQELLTGISARTDALAAINGGYFVVGPGDGTPGDLAGSSVLEGEAVSEAVDGRTGLVLPEGDGEGADVAAL